MKTAYHFVNKEYFLLNMQIKKEIGCWAIKFDIYIVFFYTCYFFLQGLIVLTMIQ